MKKLKIPRREAIINSARDLILEGGVQNVTIRNIAKKNDITEGAIYKHFKSKKEILLGVVDAFGRELITVVDSMIGTGRDSITILKDIMKKHMKFSEKKKGMLFSITAESIHFDDDEIRLAILGIIEKYIKKIEDILKQAKKNKLINCEIDVRSVSFIFFGMIQSAIVQYALTNYKSTPVSKFNAMWKVFIEGIKKRQ
ncbi:MAG: TetR/AcrR family transcriptional regulator [Candidatus Omnitrophica bacterium]|nr:TetR/AcrR family transcriptional regulator [Candidatus Omnitrophota bacterium]